MLPSTPEAILSFAQKWNSWVQTYSNGADPTAPDFAQELDEPTDLASDLAMPPNWQEEEEGASDPRLFTAYLRLADAYDLAKSDPAKALSVAAKALQKFANDYLAPMVGAAPEPVQEAQEPPRETHAEPAQTTAPVATKERAEEIPPQRTNTIPAQGAHSTVEQAAASHYLAERELCASLRLHRTTLYRLRKKGLPFLRVSRKKLLYDVTAVTQWLAERKEALP